MHEYDTVLKSLLTDSPNSFFQQITGAKRGRWLNVELPKVVQARVDLLFETEATDELILPELQSRNDATMLFSPFSGAMRAGWKLFAASWSALLR